jgi:hypothetical protein
MARAVGCVRARVGSEGGGWHHADAQPAGSTPPATGVSPSLSLSHTHTHTVSLRAAGPPPPPHTHMHAHTHTRTHARAHARTWSFILSNSSMRHTPLSASTSAPPSSVHSRVTGSLCTPAVRPTADAPLPACRACRERVLSVCVCVFVCVCVGWGRGGAVDEVCVCVCESAEAQQRGAPWGRRRRTQRSRSCRSGPQETGRRTLDHAHLWCTPRGWPSSPHT